LLAEVLNTPEARLLADKDSLERQQQIVQHYETKMQEQISKKEEKQYSKSQSRGRSA
jgi:hypothetical protein